MIKLSKVQIITALQRVLRDSAMKYESAEIADCMEENPKKQLTMIGKSCMIIRKLAGANDYFCEVVSVS